MTELETTKTQSASKDNVIQGLKDSLANADKQQVNSLKATLI